MAMLGDIPIDVIRESRSYNNKIAEHPVERGADIADHVDQEGVYFDLSGQYTGPDAAQVEARLRQLRNNPEPLTYTGRGMMVNAIIETFNSSAHSGIANGFEFSMTIKQVRIARPSTVSLLDHSIRSQVKDVGNAGRVQAV